MEERIQFVENTAKWTQMRDTMTVGMFEEWRATRGLADCGKFRTRTFEKLALKMIERFSNCTLTAKHCKNKHKRMKEKYQYAADMLVCSGFGWNEEK
ncbi:hypothetical protein PIB30_069130 [Stylosanthes scabra]|uniref:Myb/SANT-like domain-containing protein n=1 Tax=Stylosanthes scabra TaxID=79078 RepID=A0ABU6RNN1_9FABA|nr:hypothetical protein [Stylosanthes scabra]